MEIGTCRINVLKWVLSASKFLKDCYSFYCIAALQLCGLLTNLFGGFFVATNSVCRQGLSLDVIFM